MALPLNPATERFVCWTLRVCWLYVNGAMYDSYMDGSAD